MTRIFAAIIAGLLAIPPAWSQTSRPAPRPALALPSPAELLTALVADAQAASADAKANNDTIAQTCYDAITVAAQAKLASTVTPGGGLLTAFQKVRDLTRMNASPVGTQLIIGCAPLAQDARVNLVQMLTNVGAATLLKGFILPVVP